MEQTQQVGQRQGKWPFVLAVAVVLLAVWLVYDYAYRHHTAGYAAREFVSALQHGDRAKVLALESVALRQRLQIETANENHIAVHPVKVTDNYLDVAKADAGVLPMLLNPHGYIGPKVTTGSYKGAGGVSGKAETFSYAASGSKKLMPAFAIDLVPHGHGWLVDDVIPYATATNAPR